MRDRHNDIVGRLGADRAAFVCKTRKLTGDMFKGLRLGGASADPGVAGMSVIEASGRIEQMMRENDKKSINDLVQSMNWLIATRLDRYDGPALAACLPFLDAARELLLASLSHRSGPGRWEHDVWESLDGILAGAAKKNDLPVFARTWDIFTDVLHKPVWEGCGMLGSARAARIMGRCLAASPRGRSWEIAEIVLGQVAAVASSPLVKEAPNEWAEAVHDGMSAVLEAVVTGEDIAGLDAVIRPAAAAQAAMHGTGDRWYADPVCGTARLCDERGSYRLLEVVVRRMLEMERDGGLDCRKEWSKQFGSTLNSILVRAVRRRGEIGFDFIMDAIASFKHEGTIRSKCLYAIGDRGSAA